MNTSSKTILPSVYLGPISWYWKLFSADEILIEQHEHYHKQTFRNRCRIVGANGIQDLVIPVHAENHTPMHDVRIEYDGNWQRQHWQSIRSAYGNSPFFNFYADYFSPFYHNRKWEKLIDFNLELFFVTMKIMKAEKKINFTEEYFQLYENANDFRKSAEPKIEIDFVSKKYLQVFQERHGFISNPSIIDLLCCCGPDSKNHLLKIDN